MLDDTKWVDDYSNQDDELAKTAKDLLSNVTDPKLVNSDVSSMQSQCCVYLAIISIFNQLVVSQNYFAYACCLKKKPFCKIREIDESKNPN